MQVLMEALSPDHQETGLPDETLCPDHQKTGLPDETLGPGQQETGLPDETLSSSTGKENCLGSGGKFTQRKDSNSMNKTKNTCLESHSLASKFETEPQS